MKIKSIFLTVLFFISILFVQSCDTTEITNPTIDPAADDPTASLPASDDPTKSGIHFKLVDAPDDNYDQVMVDIIDFQYQRDDESGWVSFDGYPMGSGSNMVDLTELIAGTSHVLADEEIEPGLFSKVRIVLGDKNYLVLANEDGEEVPLKTPSAQQSGLKIHVDTDLQAGYSYEFVLDWDVQKSIVKAGNSGIYNLKPVIRAHTEINAGDISGMVYEMDGDAKVPLEGAIIEVYDSNGEYYTSSTAHLDGKYLISTVPIGEYKLVSTYTLGAYVYNEKTAANVSVEKDEITTQDFELTKKTIEVVGRVADNAENEADSGEMPLESAIVKIYFIEENNSETMVTEATSISDGSFSEMLDLRPGNYVAYAMLDGYLDANPIYFVILADSLSPFDIGSLFLDKNVGSIDGMVVASADDSPLGGVMVTVYMEGDIDTPIGDPVYTSNADDVTKGSFIISDLPPGNYILKATQTDYTEGQSGVIEVIFDTTANAGTISLTVSS